VTRISVLLPTRQGESLLGVCLDAVLAEDDPDIELVVSDNANSDATPEILAARAGDPRLKVVRQDRVLSVTDNWNAAWASCTGDYAVLIGDDDLLLPGYFARLRRLLAESGEPECLTYSCYAFVMPSAIAGLDRAHYADPHFRIETDLLAARRLDAGQRAGIVADMFRFRPRLPLNLQSTVFARTAAERLPRGLFRAPFPDHYALNGMLMTAESWACVPDQLAVIGVSPKSFGHYSFSGETERGLAYLDSEIGFPGRLPGNELLTAMYRWLLLLQDDFPQAAGLRISRGDYVVRQAWDWLRAWRLGSLDARGVLANLALLDPRDWLLGLRLVADPEIIAAAGARLRLRGDQRADHVWLGLRPAPDGVESMSEFAAWVTGYPEASSSA
jgi:hypothetical protein